MTPELLGHHRDLAHPRARAAVRLGDEESEPSELAHRAPQRGVVAERVVEQRAHPLAPRLALEHHPRRRRQLLALLRGHRPHAVTVLPALHRLSWRQQCLLYELG